MSKQLENKVKQLNARISSQSDELVSIKSELAGFKRAGGSRHKTNY